MTTQTAVGYVRVSTAMQSQDGVSLAAQEAKIRAWCALNDYELIGLHIDAGLSGAKARNRPDCNRRWLIAGKVAHWLFTPYPVYRGPSGTRLIYRTDWLSLALIWLAYLKRLIRLRRWQDGIQDAVGYG